MRIDELVIGETYFMVTYPEPSLIAPIVITYRYLGRDLAGVQEDSRSYYFRYLPAFHREGEHSRGDAEVAWREMLPALFGGWGEDIPTTFEESKVIGLLTLDELITELSQCRDRRSSGQL